MLSKLYILIIEAITNVDNQHVDLALDNLSASEPRSNEVYGVSLGGACSCYVARFGSAEEIEKMKSVYLSISEARDGAIEGLWDEVEYSNGLLSYLFDISSSKQRMEIFFSIDVAIDEQMNIDALIKHLNSTEMKPSERSYFKRHILSRLIQKN